jgi:hypothetical protein
LRPVALRAPVLPLGPGRPGALRVAPGRPILPPRARTGGAPVALGTPVPPVGTRPA